MNYFQMEFQTQMKLFKIPDEEEITFNEEEVAEDD